MNPRTHESRTRRSFERCVTQPRPLLWKMTPVVALALGFYVWQPQELFLFAASAIAAAAAVSALAGRYFTARAVLRVNWPQTAHAGTSRELLLLLHNAGWIPSPLLTVRAAVLGTAESKAAEAGVLAAGERAELALGLHFNRRGVFKTAVLEVDCEVLGFFRVRRLRTVPLNLVVHPAVWVLSEKAVGPGSPYASAGTSNLPLPGHDIEFLGVREYAHGDSPRLLHWRTSARRGRLFVKEFARSSRADVTLLLDLGAAGPWSGELAEALVTAAASTVHLLRGLHLRYQLAATGREPAHVRFGLGEPQYLHAMHVLTQLAHGGGRDAAAMLRALAPGLLRPNSLLVFSVFPTRALLDLLEGLAGQGLSIALVAPWLKQLPPGALAEQPEWEAVGPGGRELRFPVHRFSDGKELERAMGRLG